LRISCGDYMGCDGAGAGTKRGPAARAVEICHAPCARRTAHCALRAAGVVHRARPVPPGTARRRRRRRAAGGLSRRAVEARRDRAPLVGSSVGAETARKRDLVNAGPKRLLCRRCLDFLLASSLSSSPSAPSRPPRWTPIRVAWPKS